MDVGEIDLATHHGEQVTVTGIVKGYPDTGYVKLGEDTDSGLSDVIFIDRRDSAETFARGETVTVTGELDVDTIDKHPPTQFVYVLQLSAVTTPNAQETF